MRIPCPSISASRRSVWSVRLMCTLLNPSTSASCSWGERHLEAPIARQLHRREPVIELEQQMRHPLFRVHRAQPHELVEQAPFLELQDGAHRAFARGRLRRRRPAFASARPADRRAGCSRTIADVAWQNNFRIWRRPSGRRRWRAAHPDTRMSVRPGSMSPGANDAAFAAPAPSTTVNSPKRA